MNALCDSYGTVKEEHVPNILYCSIYIFNVENVLLKLNENMP